MERTRADDDEEFDRKVSKDIDDNWAGILSDRILTDAGELHTEVRRIVDRQPEIKACLTAVEPLVKRIHQDSMVLRKTLIRHGLLPVFSRGDG